MSETEFIEAYEAVTKQNAESTPAEGVQPSKQEASPAEVEPERELAEYLTNLGLRLSQVEVITTNLVEAVGPLVANRAARRAAMFGNRHARKAKKR